MDERDRKDARLALARSLCELREARSMPVDYWAYKLEVSRATVLRWERGLAVPAGEQLDRVAQLFWLEVMAPHEVAELRALVNFINGRNLPVEQSAALRAIERYRADRREGFPPSIAFKHVPIGIREELIGYEQSDKRPPAPASIFVSYRREGSAARAAQIVQCLRARYGDQDVFFDKGIAPGAEFLQEILSTLEKCNVVVVVIGLGWEGPRDDTRPRIFDVGDYVSVEVSTALGRAPAELRILPVLVGGRSMPSKKDLPAQLSRLGDLNALLLRDEHWLADCRDLVRAIAAIVPDEQ